MRELSTVPPGVPRSLRAGVGDRACAAPAKQSGGQRTRRGSLTALQSDWRRCEMGTNHIACFGVWRHGTRRQALRLNRSGTTRWHMPHRSGAASPGDARDLADPD